MFLKVWSLVSSDTPTIKKRAPEGREKTHGKRAKSNLRASHNVLVKYVSSVCALTEDIYKKVNLDKQHPLLATISLNILAPTLLGRLL